MKNNKLFLTFLVSLGLSLAQIVLPPLREALASAGTLTLGIISEDSLESPFTYRNEDVEKAITLFSGSGKEFFSRALANSGRYIDRVKAIFRAEGIPEPLAYLAMIESGFNNNALSRASAVGMWQFMSETGRGYGLMIGGHVDERRDFIRATRAAAVHLRDLYGAFGDWYLALASYNAGAGYIRAKMRQTGAGDYWALAPHLYTETQLYVPRFLAACAIARNPGHFGFGAQQLRQPDHFERVVVKNRSTLAQLALLHGVPVAAMARLNPHLRSGIIPATREGLGVNIPLENRTAWRPLGVLADLIHGTPDNG